MNPLVSREFEPAVARVAATGKMPGRAGT